jgi:hypothetical protein
VMGHIATFWQMVTASKYIFLMLYNIMQSYIMNEHDKHPTNGTFS